MKVRNTMRNTKSWVSAAVLVTLAACAPRGEALYARAESAVNKGDYRAAVIDLKNFIQKSPDNAKARALLGRALVASGDIEGGKIEIQKAKELGAPRELTLVSECKAMVATGDLQAALKQCNPDGASAAAKPELQLARASALLGTGDKEGARVLFAEAVTARPDNLEALVGLASATAATSGKDAGLAIMNKAPASMQGLPRYWLAFGGLQMSAGDFAAAEKSFVTARDKAGNDKHSNDYLVAYASIAEAQVRQNKLKEAMESSAGLGKIAPDNVMVKQLRGQIAAAGNQMDEARSLLEEVVTAQPDNAQARMILGMINLQQGNLGQAEMHLSNVVANHPDDVRAKQLLAQARSRQQTPEESLANLKKAIADNTADASTLVAAGRMSLAQGDKAQALKYITQAAARPEVAGSVNAQLEVANGYLMAGEYARAIELLKAMPPGGATGYQREYMLLLAMLRKGDKDQAMAEAQALIARSGNDPQARNLVAGVYAAAGKPDLGREQFNEALKLKPDDVDTLINLARLDLAQGKPEAAEQSFKRILEKDPKNLTAQLGAGLAASARRDNKAAEQWLIKARDDHPQSVEAQLALAQFYIGITDVAKARKTIDDAIKVNPKNGALMNTRGLTQLAGKDLKGAVDSFAQAAKLEPKNYSYSLNLARAHQLNRDLPAAMAVIDEVLKQQPALPPALLLGATMSLQSNNVEKAAGYTERLRRAAPDSPTTFQLEADLAMAQKRYKDALQLYAKADPGQKNRAIQLARFNAARLSDTPQPEKILLDWAAASPNDPVAVTTLAEWHRANGRTAIAITEYEKAVQKTGGNAVLLNNLAMLYDEKQDPRALATAEKAYLASPNAFEIQDTYGWLLFNSGKTEKGLELLRSAAKGVPDNSEVQYHLAAALAKSGEKEQAVPLLRKALAGNMPAAPREAAQKLLAELTK